MRVRSVPIRPVGSTRSFAASTSRYPLGKARSRVSCPVPSPPGEQAPTFAGLPRRAIPTRSAARGRRAVESPVGSRSPIPPGDTGRGRGPPARDRRAAPSGWCPSASARRASAYGGHRAANSKVAGTRTRRPEPCPSAPVANGVSRTTGWTSTSATVRVPVGVRWIGREASNASIRRSPQSSPDSDSGFDRSRRGPSGGRPRSNGPDATGARRTIGRNRHVPERRMPVRFIEPAAAEAAHSPHGRPVATRSETAGPPGAVASSSWPRRRCRYCGCVERFGDGSVGRSRSARPGRSVRTRLAMAI